MRKSEDRADGPSGFVNTLERETMKAGLIIGLVCAFTAVGCTHQRVERDTQDIRTHLPPRGVHPGSEAALRAIYEAEAKERAPLPN